MRQFRTVFQFEIMSYLRSRPYLISTAALVCLALLLGIIPSILSGLGLLGNDKSEKKENGEAHAPIGIYDAKGTLTEEALDVFLGEGAWVRIDSADPDKISEAVSSGQYSLVLEADGLSYTVTRPGSGAMRFAGADYDQMIRQGWQSAALKEKGLSQNDIDAVINAAPTAAYVSVGKDAGQSFWLGFILLMALYMAIIMYGQYVMTSVVAEKTSKTVELLITSVKPVYLMFGKVLGAGLAGLMQLCAIILAGTVSLNLSKGAWMAISPSVAGMMDLSAAGSTFFYALIFFFVCVFIRGIRLHGQSGGGRQHGLVLPHAAVCRRVSGGDYGDDQSRRRLHNGVLLHTLFIAAGDVYAYLHDRCALLSNSYLHCH